MLEEFPSIVDNRLSNRKKQYFVLDNRLSSGIVFAGRQPLSDTIDFVLSAGQSATKGFVRLSCSSGKVISKGGR